MSKTGKITKIASSLVVAIGIPGVRLGEVVLVGNLKLRGEVIELRNDLAWIQVYEDTSGLGVGEPAMGTGELLSVMLGPGLLGSAYDGIQRPLTAIAAAEGEFIPRGSSNAALPDKEWEFMPTVKVGDAAGPGDVIGSVPETGHVQHKIMVPANFPRGKITKIKSAGSYSPEVVVAEMAAGKQNYQIKLQQQWPVRTARPYGRKLVPSEPLVTGVRVIDTFFPIAKGGTANIPGPFGAGKTVAQQQIAKWANVDVVVYVGCGERGNEMTDVLTSFPKLRDPWSGESLMDRTVLIANTSNMPIAAREASVYTGMTIAEYYRDQGYSVALIADSTSRWAEALREISGRLEEIPGEEGYPAYLSSRIAQFYERSGRVRPLGEGIPDGSITTIGAISPPGGDISEPVSQSSMQVTKVFWSLDRSLAYARHYPAINWLQSYSLYLDNLAGYFAQHVHPEFVRLREQALDILGREDKLLQIIKIVGPESLTDADKVVLEIAKSLREDFLQEYGYDSQDNYSELPKQALMLSVIIELYTSVMRAVDAGEELKLTALFNGNLRTKLTEMKNMDNAEKDLQALFSSIPGHVAGHLEAASKLQQVDTYKALSGIEPESDT
ncbi:V-type ATP synthase subunit A [Candidatus Dojkabacteria bacterium]|uniref:V-type ATP synthase alpha chain n=1 Tax=Candidatus Dojkabacteria bacterium TaxID=2099670 RepID=A0A955I7N8_9BACT|nr:V-type ATP synthase subunit A [Candidatus Dojkabacteria bacterium]